MGLKLLCDVSSTAERGLAKDDVDERPLKRVSGICTQNEKLWESEPDQKAKPHPALVLGPQLYPDIKEEPSSLLHPSCLLYMYDKAGAPNLPQAPPLGKEGAGLSMEVMGALYRHHHSGGRRRVPSQEREDTDAISPPASVAGAHLISETEAKGGQGFGGSQRTCFGQKLFCNSGQAWTEITRASAAGVWKHLWPECAHASVGLHQCLCRNTPSPLANRLHGTCGSAAGEVKPSPWPAAMETAVGEDVRAKALSEEDKDRMVLEVLQMYCRQQEVLHSTLQKQRQLEMASTCELDALRSVAVQPGPQKEPDEVIGEHAPEKEECTEHAQKKECTEQAQKKECTEHSQNKKECMESTQTKKINTGHAQNKGGESMEQAQNKEKSTEHAQNKEVNMEHTQNKEVNTEHAQNKEEECMEHAEKGEKYTEHAQNTALEHTEHAQNAGEEHTEPVQKKAEESTERAQCVDKGDRDPTLGSVRQSSCTCDLGTDQSQEGLYTSQLLELRRRLDQAEQDREQLQEELCREKEARAADLPAHQLRGPHCPRNRAPQPPHRAPRQPLPDLTPLAPPSHRRAWQLLHGLLDSYSKLLSPRPKNPHPLSRVTAQAAGYEVRGLEPEACPGDESLFRQAQAFTAGVKQSPPPLSTRTAVSHHRGPKPPFSTKARLVVGHTGTPGHKMEPLDTRWSPCLSQFLSRHLWFHASIGNCISREIFHPSPHIKETNSQRS
ncbi:hypothetical protein JZ751_021998 [Albula glossodonta]|uniref:Uncharacterized protein n=1 Tax=Albula glossodonta TaxID=121402 RepID=A0A8T2NR96_9TELE|nr:hypothetical protein JZ751_021998 [Albula glossodonta]